MSEYKPETVLKAAKLVDPNAEWKLSADGLVYYVPIAMPVFFNPLTNPADAFELWKRLSMNGVIIGYSQQYQKWFIEPDYIADNTPIYDTPEAAMLACVEAMEVGG